MWVHECSRVQRARILEATRECADVRYLDSGELDRCVPATINPPDVLVLGVGDGARRDPVLLARRLSASWPRTAIVAYYEESAEGPRNLAALAAAGVQDFLFDGVNDRGIELGAVLSGACLQRSSAIVLEAVRAVLPVAVHALAEAVLHRPRVVTTLRTLAESTGMHLRTLHDRCRRRAGIHPRELLKLVRLALVAELLDDTAATVEAIAYELDFPSPTALRNSLKRLTGKTATEIRRDGGGLQLVVQCMQRALAPLRRKDVALQVTLEQHETD